MTKSSSSNNNSNTAAGSAGTKRSLLSQTWGSECEESRTLRKRNENKVSDMLRHKMYDNAELKGMTYHEMNGIVDPKTNMNMRQRVEDDIKKDLKVKGTIKWGSTYWRTVRSLYQDPNRPSKLLPPPAMPSASLFQALTEYNHPGKPNARALVDWMLTAGSSCEQADVVAVCRCMSELNWGGAEPKLLLGLDIADFLQRQDLRSRFPAVYKAMQKEFDGLLLLVRKP